VNRKANNSGIVTWSWIIGSNTARGTGNVEVTCAGETRTSSIVIN
jgi:hypothetical protein